MAQHDGVCRVQQIKHLKSDAFDLIIVGAGATGAGSALDASLRGMKVALIDRGDFASGTSSRSTKLVHGGVRYLERAVKGLDYSQLSLVRDALQERKTLLRIAPHLVRKLGLVTPIYSAWKLPYLLTGLKLYDFVSGRASFGASRYLCAREVLRRFPQVNSRGLVGGILYFDGQFDDARMNIELVLTAEQLGARVANYLEVQSLLKSVEGSGESLVGVQVRDILSGNVFSIKGKVVINATGPYADALRMMDEPTAQPLMRVSSGAHIVVSSAVCPRELGMLIPETKDGRVLFVLPWRGHTIIGTTDKAADLVADPQATEAEIDYIIQHINRYLCKPIKRSDVLSEWSGLRPLVQLGEAGGSTAQLSRDHYLDFSRSGLVTITGGKWTTYRLMAKDVIDAVVSQFDFSATQVDTSSRKLVGAIGKIPSVQQLCQLYGLDVDVASHLRSTYGSQSHMIGRLAQDGGNQRLSDYFPIIKAEVIYTARFEMIVSAQDFLSRRVRASFLNQEKAEELVPLVEQILMETLPVK